LTYSQNGNIFIPEMWIISKRRLIDFWEIHPDAETPLRVWHTFADDASWETPHDIKQLISSMDVLGNDRYCFNIGGNKYRLIVKIVFEKYRIYIRFIGTHEEYDALDNASKV